MARRAFKYGDDLEPRALPNDGVVAPWAFKAEIMVVKVLRDRHCPASPFLFVVDAHRLAMK